MTPERKEEIRRYLNGRATLSDEIAEELLAALDAAHEVVKAAREGHGIIVTSHAPMLVEECAYGCVLCEALKRYDEANRRKDTSVSE